MYGYIYLILNKVNGKTYVGKRKLYKKTWNEDNYMGSGIHLKSAIKKYGIENFEKFLIEYTSSEEDACKKEEFWIAEYKRRCKAEYNISKGGDGGYILKYASEERKEEYRKKLSKNNAKYWKGKHPSEETRKKLSKVHKGRTSPMKGKHLSKETKMKLSKACKGKHWKLVDGKRVYY